MTFLTKIQISIEMHLSKIKNDYNLYLNYNINYVKSYCNW